MAHYIVFSGRPPSPSARSLPKPALMRSVRGSDAPHGVVALTGIQALDIVSARVRRQVSVHVAGDTVTDGQIADIIDRLLDRKVERVPWDVPKQQAGLVRDPDDAVRKYRIVFAEGSRHGVGHGHDLERPTRLPDLVQADDGAAGCDKCEVDVTAPFVAHGEAAKLGEPGVGALDDPPVAAKVLTAVDATTGDAGLDAGLAALVATATMVMAFVGMQFDRTPAWTAAPPAANCGNGVQCLGQHHAVVPVGAAQDDAECRAGRRQDGVSYPLVPIRRVGSRRGSRFFAETEALSSATRLQSNCPAASRCSSNARSRAAHTPACCQSRSLRQQVIPDPHPISAGRYSQGRPVRSTNRMPVKAAWSETGGLPPFGRGCVGGSNGSTTDQRSSGTRSLLMIPNLGSVSSTSSFCWTL